MTQRASIRLGLHPYDLQPLLKVLKHLIYIKENLLWVWTGWGVSITSTNRGSKCITRQITLRSHRAYNKAGVTSLWPSSHCWRCWSTLYMYKEDLLWVWTGWGVSITSTNRGSKCESINITLRSHREDIRLGLHPYDLQPLLKVLKHFIYV